MKQLYPKTTIYILVMCLKAVVNALTVFESAMLLSSVVDDVLTDGIGRGLEKNIIKLLFIIVLGITCFLLEYLKSYLLESGRINVMCKVFKSIVAMSYDKIGSKNSSEYFNMVDSDLKLSAGFYQKLDEGIGQFAASIGAMAFIFSMDWRLGTGLFILGIVIIFYNSVISPKFGQIQKEIQTDDCKIKNIVMQEYKSYEYRNFYDFAKLGGFFDSAYDDYIKSNLKKARWRAITSVFGYLIGFLQTYLPLFLAAAVLNGYTLGNVLALISNAAVFMGIFRSIGNIITGMKESDAGTTRIVSYIDSVEKQQEEKQYCLDPCMKIKVDQLYYSYGTVYSLSIDHWTWDGEQSIGIVGEKGSGKSTFIKILVGLLKNYEGTFDVNGHEIKQLSAGICNWVSYMSQDFPVFDMTIIENFRVMAPDKSEQEYMEYAALVNMDKEILAMPQGLHTPIRSSKLSTGQRQRLSLCMILLRDTPYIVLDEPVSNLDLYNRKIIQKIIAGNINKKYVVVSHEMDIFDDSFQIYKMKDGKLQAGSFFVTKM